MNTDRKQRVCLTCSLTSYLLSIACAILGPIVYFFIENPIEAPLLITASLLLPLFDSYRRKEVRKKVRGANYLAVLFGTMLFLVMYYKENIQVLLGEGVSLIALGFGLILATNLFCLQKR